MNDPNPKEIEIVRLVGQIFQSIGRDLTRLRRDLNTLQWLMAANLLASLVILGRLLLT